MASTSMAAAKPQRKPRLVYPKLGIPFILLVLCFAAWGSAANLTDVLVSVFRSIFTMSNFQSALVQFAYYGGFFLLALFVLAAGLSILETSANPFVIAMGPEDSATQRLNLAQSFNPVGANIGVLLGAVLILPHITSEAAKTIMSPAELRRSQESDLSLVLGPYLGIASVLLLIWLLILFRRMAT